MLSDLLDGTSRASGPVVVSALALAGTTYLLSQLIMHREAERAVPLCEAGYRAKASAPSLEELGREITRELFKQMLPKESAPIADWLTRGVPHTASNEPVSRCRCYADVALDDSGLKSRYWFWVATLKLAGPRPSVLSGMARAERQGACGKEA